MITPPGTTLVRSSTDPQELLVKEVHDGGSRITINRRGAYIIPDAGTMEALMPMPPESDFDPNRDLVDALIGYLVAAIYLSFHDSSVKTAQVTMPSWYTGPGYRVVSEELRRKGWKLEWAPGKNSGESGTFFLTRN